MEEFNSKEDCGGILMKKTKKIVFAVPSTGQFQFIIPILEKMIEKKMEYIYILAHQGDESRLAFDTMYPSIKEDVIHTKLELVKKGDETDIDMYITSEQYTLGIKNIFSVCIFHGQPSKGLTFTKEIIASFDAFFLYGPLHLEAYMNYVEEHFETPPEHLQTFKIGYSKTDVLFSNSELFPEIPKKIGLLKDRKTILYAPAFNKYASLQENGLFIINELCKNQKYNVIVKLPIDCFNYKNMPQEFNDVNWLEELKKLEETYNNLFLYDQLDIYPVMVHADLMLTCVSSVGLEFMVLKKPVMFIETPNFYRKYLKGRLPHIREIAAYKNKEYVNGGKRLGVIVQNISSLDKEIEVVLENYEEIQEKLRGVEDYLLYNPGNAAETAANKIIELVEQISISKRTYEYNHFTYDFVEILNSKKEVNIGLVGAGKYGEDIYDLIKENNDKVSISCYLDNDTKKWSKKINNTIIEPISSEVIEKLDKIIITSMYWREILVQLENLSISSNKIVLVTRY